jgi:hypothetical protein
VISPYSCHRLITRAEDILGRPVLHRNWEVNWAESAEPSTFQHKKLSKRLSGSDDASRVKICYNLKPLSPGGYGVEGVQILEQKCAGKEPSDADAGEPGEKLHRTSIELVKIERFLLACADCILHRPLTNRGWERITSRA